MGSPLSKIVKPYLIPTLDHNLFINPNNKIVKLDNCPENWSEYHLQKYFDLYMKAINRIVLGKNSVGNFTGKAYLFFNNSDEATKFIDKYHNDYINTPDVVTHLKASLYMPKKQKEKIKVLRDDRQIELYNLAFEASNMDILGLIRDQNTIEDFYLPMRSTNKNKGFAIITFTSKYSADDFMQEINGLTLFGRELKARAKFISFNTQVSDFKTKSDKVIENAENRDIKIKGAIEKYKMILFKE